MNTPKVTSEEKKALQEFVHYLQQSIPDKIVSVALFGSKARGDCAPDSDVDVLVILNQENRELRRSILKMAARISLDHDVLLSPGVIGQQRWDEMRGFSLYRNILQEATEVDLIEGSLALKPPETA
jgi:predicted nucleotidyltransferase